jgi:plastocyanin
MSIQSRPNNPAGTLVAIVIVVLILIAVWWLFLGNQGSGGPSSSTSPGASPSAAGESPSVEASASPTGDDGASPSPSEAAGELEVTAKDFSFEAPPTVAAGVVTVSVKNGGNEDHQAQLARIADGKTLADVVAALQANEAAAFALLTFSGGPTGATPGSTATATTSLEPGNYAMLCFILSPDGVPHIAKGMVASLEVTEPATGATMEEGEAEVAMTDFAYEPAVTLSAGAHVIAVKNGGPQPHEATVVLLNDGVTIESLKTAFAAGQPPAPPYTRAGGIAAIAANMEGTIHLDLPAGSYAFICFLPDPATGKSHAELGMIGGLTVE